MRVCEQFLSGSNKCNDDDDVGIRNSERGNRVAPYTDRAVARGWAGWAMAHPVFWRFMGKSCKVLHFRHFLYYLAHPVSKCYLQL